MAPGKCVNKWEKERVSEYVRWRDVSQVVFPKNFSFCFEFEETTSKKSSKTLTK